MTTNLVNFVPSKVLEEFVAEWILEDIADKIDPKQFGSMTTGGPILPCVINLLRYIFYEAPCVAKFILSLTYY